MKISTNWLKNYLDFNLVPTDLAEILTNTGLEVEDTYPFSSVTGGLEGVVIGEIVSCERHPDADKLQVTQVDVGTGELLQIVCGAPNCRVGLKSPIALVGATLYPHSGDKIQIKKAKIRGVESRGMICADDELGLGASHAGIMELDPATPVGTPAAQYFGVEHDQVIEIGLTPNRSDAFSHIGVARDLSAALSTVYKVDLPLTKPDTALTHLTALRASDTTSLIVTVTDTKACPRYSGISISGITVAPSPAWLQNRLKAIGLRPINNVVDITNFVLHEYGQPLHAFDADRIRGAQVIVRTLPSGTVFKTLDGTDRTLHEQDLMICDAEGPMCIAGVFGGIDSGVTDATKTIFLESAYFDPISVRKTAARHALRTDAAMHFEKTTDINITVDAVTRAAMLICEIAGGHISGDLIDHYPTPIDGYPVDISLARIHALAGVHIPAHVVRNILTKLEIKIVAESGDKLSLMVPTFKADVRREADVLEEILRIYGYNTIPMPASLKSSLSFSPALNPVALENTAAQLLTGSGYREISTNSISQSAYEIDPTLQTQIVKLANAQSAEMDSMRASMLYSGLEVIAYNQNRKNADLRLYEIGKTYHRIGDQYLQRQHLVIYHTGHTHADNWLSKSVKYDFFHLRSIVETILHRFGVSGTAGAIVEAAPYLFASQLLADGSVLATYGQIDPQVLSTFDIKQEVFYADINWDLLMERSSHHRVRYQPLPKYPAVRRDLAMIVDADLRFEQIQQLCMTENKKLLREVYLFDVYTGDKIEQGKKSYAVSFTFLDPDKTLTDQDIDKAMNKLMTKLESELKVTVRKA